MDTDAKQQSDISDQTSDTDQYNLQDSPRGSMFSVLLSLITFSVLVLDSGIDPGQYNPRAKSETLPKQRKWITNKVL